MKKIFKEPIVIFLLLGITFYMLNGWITKSAVPEENRIEVTNADVEQLAVQFSQTWMRPATAEEMEGLVNEFVRDEVYYREAMAMGLDKDDKVVRRRMRQKLEIMLNDMTTANVPSDQVLRTYMEENQEIFRQDPIITFEQVYLNADQRPNIDKDAANMLVQLKGGTKPENVGDPTMLGYVFRQYTLTDVRRQFGEEFASRLIEITPGTWEGPIYSGLGGHIVQVHEVVAGRMPELAEVRDIVEREWLAERSKELKDETYLKILENYEVVINGAEPENEK